jgi:hypothetical protein
MLPRLVVPRLVVPPLVVPPLVLAMLAAVVASAMPEGAGAAEHTCDPVTDEGWSALSEREILSQHDGAPYRAGANWFVRRTTTMLPFCHYFNSIGIYSMRSYSLDPVTSEEEVTICQEGRGGLLAVPPYAGPCPPG